MQEKRNEYHKWLEIECRANKMSIGLREMGIIIKFLTMKHASVPITSFTFSMDFYYLNPPRNLPLFNKNKKNDIRKSLLEKKRCQDV